MGYGQQFQGMPQMPMGMPQQMFPQAGGFFPPNFLPQDSYHPQQSMHSQGQAPQSGSGPAINPRFANQFPPQGGLPQPWTQNPQQQQHFPNQYGQYQ
jgi:hypothetical protein